MTSVIVGVSARAMAASAVRAGYAIRTVDFFGDEDLRRLAPNLSLQRDLGHAYSAEALFAAATREPADRVVWLASLENHPEIIAAFAGRSRVVGCSAEAVARVRDWAALARCVERHDIKFPRTIEAGEDVPPGVWLVKPRRSGGGHGIDVWRGGPVAKGWLVQEHIAGLACSVAFAADGHGVSLMGVSEQLIGRPEFGASHFRYCGSIYPLSLHTPLRPSDLMGSLQRLVEAVVEEFGLVGVGGVDFIFTPTGTVVPLEVNPRYTASMELIERAGGGSVFDAHVRASEGVLPRSAWRPAADGYWGKAILFADRDVRVPDTAGWFDRGVADIPPSGQMIAAGRPVCTVFAHAGTRDACLAGLIARAEEIRRDLYG
ncbi:MAG: ATP-grasp domain-containing protein [Armatimonadota bacterium]|nr:ATP-grasp domain-containing protein [Armatimonadota bacterium]